MDEIGALTSAAQRELAAAARPGNAEAAREFEGYLLHILLDEMRRTVGSGGLFDGQATRGYQALLDDALTRQMAQRGGLGLAAQMIDQWEPER
jgi:Rod binding domain-containing protein